MHIETVVMKRLNSYENSELQRILEAVEYQALYQSGLSKISGGYSTAEAYDIIEEDDYDEETDTDYDFIEIEVETGEQGCGYTESLKTCHKLSRKHIGNKKMTLREKIQAIEEA